MSNKLFIAATALFFTSLSNSGVASNQPSLFKSPKDQWLLACENNPMTDHQICKIAFLTQANDNTSDIVGLFIYVEYNEAYDYRRKFQIGVIDSRPDIEKVGLRIDKGSSNFSNKCEQYVCEFIWFPVQMIQSLRSGTQAIISIERASESPIYVKIPLSDLNRVLETAEERVAEQIDSVDQPPSTEKFQSVPEVPGPEKSEPPSQPLSEKEFSNLQIKVAQCWHLPENIEQNHRPAVKIHIWLDPDGSFSRPPEVVREPSLDRENQNIQAISESALRAVHNCRDAFASLPREKYRTWRDIILTFDPNEVLLKEDSQPY